MVGIGGLLGFGGSVVGLVFLQWVAVFFFFLVMLMVWVFFFLFFFWGVDGRL